MRLAYLATPYSHESSLVMEQRVIEADHVAAELLKCGVNVFSPITHSHRLLPHFEANKQGKCFAKTWEFWKEVDIDLLSRCDCLVVICVEGWMESTGVQAEIAHAVDVGMPRHYINSAEDVKNIAKNILEPRKLISMI